MLSETIQSKEEEKKATTRETFRSGRQLGQFNQRWMTTKRITWSNLDYNTTEMWNEKKKTKNVTINKQWLNMAKGAKMNFMLLWPPHAETGYVSLGYRLKKKAK